MSIEESIENNEHNQKRSSLINKTALKEELKKAIEFNDFGENAFVEKVNISSKALIEIISRLEEYIQEQISLLRLTMPRIRKGPNKGKLKKKTIDIDHVIETGFPNIPKIGVELLKKDFMKMID